MEYIILSSTLAGTKMRKQTKQNSYSYEGRLREDSFDIRFFRKSNRSSFFLLVYGLSWLERRFRGGVVQNSFEPRPPDPILVTSYWISLHCLLSSLDRPLTHVDGNKREKARHGICDRFYSLVQIGRTAGCQVSSCIVLQRTHRTQQQHYITVVSVDGDGTHNSAPTLALNSV